MNHLINVHQEIIPGLSSGWFLSRCPLAYSGCSFASENMAPNSDKIRLRFSRADDNFCSRMVDDEEIRANAKQNTKPKNSFARKNKGEYIQLAGLNQSS